MLEASVLERALLSGQLVAVIIACASNFMLENYNQIC